MRRQRTSVILILLGTLLSGSGQAIASSLAFSRNARTYNTIQSSLVEKGLAHACLAVPSLPDDLPCAPSLTPFNHKPLLTAQAMASNGYKTLDQVRKITQNDGSEELINSMFSGSPVVQIEANTQLTLVSHFLNAQYTPITAKGFAVLRNEADPDAELSATYGSGFSFQSGAEVMKGFYVGLQTRFISRHYVIQRFKLTDLGTTQGKDLLKPKIRNATYIEPAVTWAPAVPWRPVMTVMVANLGLQSPITEGLPDPVEPQVGAALSPPVPFGTLTLAIDYRSLGYDESAMGKFHFGALYRFGAMYLTGGLDSDGLSGGIYYSIEHLNAGILYTTTATTQTGDYTNTAYAELGWQI